MLELLNNLRPEHFLYLRYMDLPRDFQLILVLRAVGRRLPEDKTVEFPRHLNPAGDFYQFSTLAGLQQRANGLNVVE